MNGSVTVDGTCQIITLTEPPQVTVSANSTNVTCNGGTDGTITVSGLSAGATYIIQLNGTGADLSGESTFAAGNYVITASAPNGNNDGVCTATANVTITEPVIVTVNASATDVTCNGAANGTITVDGLSAGATYIIQLNGAGPDLSGQSTFGPGNYLITASAPDGNNIGVCTASTNVTIAEPAILAASAIQNSAVTCNGAGNGSATVSVTGGNLPYSYSWDNGEITATVNNLSGGLHVVDITDNKGCTTSATVNIDEPAILTASAIQNSAVTCNGAGNGSATVSVTGGNLPYSYSWDNGEITATVNNLSGGLHVVDITDNKGCTTSATVNIDEPAILTASAIQNSAVTCNGAGNGSATVSVTGGNTSFSYAWDDGETTATATGLSGGLHVVDITDDKGCSTSATVNIDEPAILTASAVQNSAGTCNGAGNGSATVSVTGGNTSFSYAWDNGETMATATGLSGGLHVVDITDNKGCTTSATVNIDEPAILTASAIQNSAVTCNGAGNGSATVSVTGGNTSFSYAWDDGETMATATGLSGGLHVVDITDNKGCTTSATVNIDEPAILSASTVQNAAVTCNGADNGSATVTVTGGNLPYSYAWDDGETTATANNLSGGLHVVDITDNKGCTTSVTINIDEPGVLTATAAQDNPVVCNGESNGTATVTVTGGNLPYSYSWDNGETTATANNLSGGLHVVDITDNKGCTTSATANITEPGVLTATAAQDNPVACNGESNGTATVTVAGGNLPYSYSWDDGETTATAGNLSAGLHVVDITDNKGCTTSATVNITEPAVLAATAAQDNPVVCNGESNGSATVTVTGGNLPYSYSWDDGETTATANNLSAGLHVVDITDNKGCTTSASVTITEPDVLAATAAQDNPVVCNGESNGIATVTVTGGNLPYSYSWDDGETTATASNLSAGLHVVDITDNKGCTTSASVSIDEPDVLTATAVEDNPVACNGESNGTATVTAADGNGGYSYLWDDTETTATATALNAGTHTVTVTDSKGCSVIASVTITEPDVLTATAVEDIPVECSGDSNGGATVTAEGGNGGYSYDWDNGETTATATALNAGPHTVTVTDSKGCSFVASITISQKPDPTISLSSGPDNQVVCINNAIAPITYAVGGNITGATVGGLPFDVSGTYDGNTGLFTISGTPHVSGTFNFTVSTTGVCANPSLNGTIIVNNNSTIDLSSAAETTAQTICTNEPIADITYAIDGGATGATVSGLPDGVTGTYNAGVFTISGTPDQTTPQYGQFDYTVTTEGPCINPELTGSITINPVATINPVSNQVVCDGISTATVAFTSPTAIITGGVITYSWTNDNTSIGLAGSGTGDIDAFTATNTGNGPVTATITVTPHYTTNSVTCDGTPVSFTITVNANSSISLSSAAETTNQTICINNAITDITYTISGGATDAAVSGSLPNGVTGSYNAGVFTISGTPGEPGTFNYTVTTIGPSCVEASLSGTITVNDNSTISLSSGTGTDAQTVCINSPISSIIYTIGGDGTGAILAGLLPSGVTGSYDDGSHTFTISGIAADAGSFPYTITTTGPCVNPDISGTITVNPSPVVTPIGNALYCNNTPGAAIAFSSPTTGGTVSYSWTSTANVGFGLSGNTHIGAYTATNSGNSPVTATVTVTPHFTNNSVTCDGSPITFTVTVNPSPVVNPMSNLTYCNTNPGTINFTSPITGGISYSWTSTVNVGFGLNGTGNIGAFTATNNSINPLIATVTVTPLLDGGCLGSSITFTVTVNPGANAGTISGSPTICTGSTAQLSTNGGAGGTWSTSTPSVATVDATGKVTGVSTGSATIFYTVTTICGGSTASFNVSVNPVATAGTISGPNTVCSGSSIVLSTNGNGGGTWFSGNTALATVNSSGVVTGVLPGVVPIYYFVSNSCGNSVTSYSVTVSPGANAGTIIGSSSICAGAATLLFTTGSGGTWGSSNPGVAFIDGTSGFVIGMSAGTATITYTVPGNSCSPGATAYFNFTVNPGANAGTITGPANVCAGSSVLLSTNGSGGGTWYTGNPALATVNSSGLVTGVSPGAVTIGYFVNNSCGTASTTFNILVSPGANAGTISGPSSVCAGSTINLTSNGTPGGTWSSSNTAAAQVDVNGVVLGIGAGTTTIKYEVTSACATSSTTTTITVNPAPNAGTVSGAASVCAGLSTMFTSNGTGGGSWSSSNPAAATVNSTTGVVTGVAAGNATITYTLTTGCGTVTASAPITVNPVLNAGTISGGPSVCMGSTLNLSASGSSGGSWTSSNTGVASIDISSGVVTSGAPGNTTITYTVSNSCGTSTATKLITVNAVANAGTVTGAAMVCTGLSTTFTSNGTAGGTWSSSNPAAATVNATSGVVTGVAAGNATITYTVTTGCGTATASAPITVNQLPDAGTISGPSAVCVSSFVNLSNNVSGGTWGSNASSIATVNSAGKVSGITPGVATITYTVTSGCGTNTSTFTITVNPVPNAGIVDGPTSVCVGSSIFLTNIGGDIGGLWKSTNTARATVNSATGEVTGLSAGNTIITYSVTNSCGSSVASIVITVNSLPDAGTISGASAVCAGATINLSASGNSGGTWTSTTPNVATVNASTGVVTGVAQGNATIIYTVGSAAVCGTSSATHLVTVNPLPDAGTINGTTTVCAGLSTTLTSSGSVGGSWSSSNPGVASVNATTGVVIGVAAGSATISYSVSNICGSATASATVTVNPVANAGTISGASSVCIGSTINLGSSVAGGTWSSSTHAVATIGPNTGIVTGAGVGNTTITYTVTTACGTATATYTVTVNPLPNAGTLSGTTFVCTGSTTTLASSSGGGTWSSSNNSAATVNATTGVVTGVSAGSSTITYTVSSGCGLATAQVVVTVGDLPAAGTVSGASTLCTGLTAIFTSNGTGGGSWSSNNTTAATVNATTGVVTGAAAGSATITYTVSSTCGSSSSSSNITISALPNAGSVSGAATLCSGSVTTFTSNGTPGGSWSSNNNLVATVNATTGVVTGVAAGSATITYTVTNTCGTATASANITINALPNSGTVSGAATLCAGANTAFTSTGNGGGSWSSNNTAAATVNATTGVVTGVAAGSATISYTVSGTCGSSVASANITINPAPDAGTLSGASSVCAGSTTTLTSTGMSWWYLEQ